MAKIVARLLSINGVGWRCFSSRSSREDFISEIFSFYTTQILTYPKRKWMPRPCQCASDRIGWFWRHGKYRQKCRVQTGELCQHLCSTQSLSELSQGHSRLYWPPSRQVPSARPLSTSSKVPRVLITGGLGQLGTGLARELRKINGEESVILSGKENH